MSKKIAIIAGTRPEVIKTAPIFLKGQSSKKFKFTSVSTGQHLEMSKQAFNTFSITPDIELNLMKDNQSLIDFFNKCLSAIDNLLKKENYAGIIVQGDTATCFAASLAGFYNKIPVAHLEAGLRTNNKYSPFPEETNRRLVSNIADIHFCPTTLSKENLKKEGIVKNVFITGNSVVDAVKIIKEKINQGELEIDKNISSLSKTFNSLIFVTSHRRENFNKPLKNLCKVLLKIRDNNPNAAIVLPVHPNPNVKKEILSTLGKQQRIFLLPPLDYPSTITLLEKSKLIITDSGGIQEEAPYFGTPVLVTRESTERPEVLENNFAKLCPLDSPEELVKSADKLLWLNKKLDSSLSPFGKGDTSEKVIKILEELW